MDKENNHNLKKCKYCGEYIAKSAKTCPHCGGKNKKHSGCLVFVLTFFTILIIMAAIVGCQGNEPILSEDAQTMSEMEFKNACNTIEYDKLARKYEKIEGKKIKLDGQLFIDFGDDGADSYKYEVNTGWSYSMMMEDTVIVYYTNNTDSKLLEEDYITIYGEVAGYEENGYPVVYAAYIDRK